MSLFSGEETGGIPISELFFARDPSTGGSNTVEVGEEFVEVADNMVSSKVPGLGGIHFGSKNSEMKLLNC